jgi:hypothetical protein
MSEARAPLQYRQGDVLLVAVEAAPERTEPVEREGGRVVLAHGEATGHAHAIADARAELHREPRHGRRFLVVGGDAPVALAHEEHATLHVAPGVYEVRTQREFFGPSRWAQVRD